MRAWLIALLLLPAAGAKDSCMECHSEPDALFKNDVHLQRGFGCIDCHGGDRTQDDQEQAMSRARGFRGKIRRSAVPELCARCHSDASLIHKFRPQQRVDQLTQFRTSVHGKRLAAGDEKAATCIDCHSVHDIRQVRDALSPVHPLRLPETCARCHADAKHMASYKIPVNQFEGYRKSVHWEALAKRGDLSAPSCASCHGNHGATPPQVASVAAVCGTCHVLMEDLFKASPHQAAFAQMGAAGCMTCHGNHEVLKPSTTMLTGKESVCAPCHEEGSRGAAVGAAMHQSITRLDAALARSDEILGLARRSGMEVSEALLAQTEARESLIKARVAVHAFAVPAVEEPVAQGLKIASETYRAGQSALKERDFRRLGLSVSLAAILAVIAGLWLMIRSLEREPGTASESARR